MSLFDIKEVKNADYYIDHAFRRANKKSEILKNRVKGEFVSKTKKIEISKIDVVKDVLLDDLGQILNNFPKMEQESVFYKELIKSFFDYGMIRKSLGSVKWAKDNIAKLSNESLRKIQNARNIDDIKRIKNAYFGRVASLIKQIDKYFSYLEDSRKKFKNFPQLKDLPTVCIVGFPNVGKTTLLFKLTGAKAKISAYAFTTLGINAGYREIKFQKVQFLDTPGTLNRFEKMNVFEKQAYIALEHLADAIVFVFDLTEEYSLEEQEKLYQEILKHKKPTMIYLSKTDIVEQEKIDAFRLTHDFTSDIVYLEKEIIKIFFKKKSS